MDLRVLDLSAHAAPPAGKFRTIEIIGKACRDSQEFWQLAARRIVPVIVLLAAQARGTPGADHSAGTEWLIYVSTH